MFAEVVSDAAAAPPPFVGREREGVALAAALAQACAGGGTVVFVTGEAGIGKTRLAEEFAGRARTARARLLWGRAWEGAAPAFWPWTEALRALVDDERADVVRARELVRLLPELGPSLVPSPGPLELDGERARFLLFDAVTALLAGATARTPTVLVLDDFHAADAASVLLLQFVAARLGASRLLIVVLLREIADTWGELARRGQRLPLAGLGEREVEALIRGRAGHAATPELVRAVHEGTGGNPLFVDEVARLLLAGGRLDGRRDVGRLPLPDGVRQAIRSRCAPLGAEARSLLRLAAVLGREFELPVLASLAGIPTGCVLDALDEAVRAGLVVATADAPGRHRFAHVLVRDALYEELRPAERLRCHRAAGEALERLHASRPDAYVPALAHHFLEAATVTGDVGRAIGYAARAAEQAIAQLAPEEAVRHCGRALELLAASPGNEADRARLLLILGEAQRAAGDVGRARATFIAAADVGRRLGSADVVARAALGLGHTGTDSGAVDRTLVELLDEALAAGDAVDGALRAHLLGRLGEALYFSDERPRAASLTADALAMARRLGRDDVLAATLVRRHLAIWGPDTTAERVAVAAEAVQAAGRARQRDVELVARSWYVADLLERGDGEAADREIAAYRDAAEDLRLPEFRWRARLLSATRALMRGELARATALVDDAVAVEGGAHGPNAVQIFAVQRVALALEGGAPGALDAIAEPMRALAERYPSLPVWRSAFARVSAELERVAEARRELELLAAVDFAHVPRDGNWLPAMMNVAETASLLADGRRAAVIYELLRPYAALHVVVAPMGACFGSVERYLGRLAVACGRKQAAERHFVRAVAADARTGAAAFVARSEYELARLRLEGGTARDRAAARLRLERVVTTARALGMPRLAGDAEALAATSGPALTTPACPRWTFRRDGELWTVGPAGDETQLRHARGLDYLHVLLRHPRWAFPALELAARGRAAGSALASGRDGPLLDERTRREYAARLADLRGELETAEAHRDVGRIATLQSEIDWLESVVLQASGLGRRARRTGSAAERARSAVTKALRAAIDRITTASPAVGHHVARSVRTGTLCRYEPDPTQSIAWDL